MEEWEKRLALLSETLDEWVAVQRNWMYLETIFCAEDIQKQLPEEAAKFQAVDKMWKVSHNFRFFTLNFRVRGFVPLVQAYLRNKSRKQT